jgi:hypothetical protein
MLVRENVGRLGYFSGQSVAYNKRIDRTRFAQELIMRRRMLFIATAIIALAASPASAHPPGWGGPRFCFGLYAPPLYFGGPPVYAPPPVYYAPRPVYAPPPVYAAPPPMYAAPAPAPAYYYPGPY